MEFLTVAECSTILRYKNSRERVYALLRIGAIKGFKRGKMWLVDKQSFDRYLKNQCGRLT